VTVKSVLSTVPLNVSFRRLLTQNNRLLWNNLVEKIMLVRFNDQKNVFT
jgi:hypothetical protein